MTESRPVFDKPTFTFPELVGAVADLLPRLPRLAEAVGGARRVEPRLRELVMLAVSEANRCRYCRTAHRELGRAAGLDEGELEALRERRWNALAPRERAAVVAALRRAGIGVPEGSGEAALEEHFVPAEVARIAALVDAIRIANLAGNTVDMFWARVRGTRRPRRDSTAASEAAVTAFWALGAVPAGLGIAATAVARRLGGGG